MAEADYADQDRIEKFELTQAPTGDTFTLKLKTKAEEFEFFVDKTTLQELVDEIYYFLDKDEPKQA
jgi:hypothetical protein